MNTPYPYRFISAIDNKQPFSKVFDFGISVPCLSQNISLDYIYRLYRFGSHLFITDIFPRMYENDNNCFKKFTSHEGFTVDMRQLSVSCLQIFISEFISQNIDNVMVVSGSYAPNESTDGVSRKLKLYHYIFSPLLEQLHLREIDCFEHNAFFLVDKDSSLVDDEICSLYYEFLKHRNL